MAAKRFTGTGGEPSTLTYPFAAKVVAPKPPVFSSADILLEKPTLTNDVTACELKGNFKNCYQASLSIPYLAYPTVFEGGTQYLTILLRIDASELKTSFQARNVSVFYEEAAGSTELPACQTKNDAYPGFPPETATRCVAGVFQYGKSAKFGELRGTSRWRDI